MKKKNKFLRFKKKPFQFQKKKKRKRDGGGGGWKKKSLQMEKIYCNFPPFHEIFYPVEQQ